MHKAGTVFQSGIRFPRFLTFVLLALFVATSQANGRFQTAAAGCRSTGLAPLRGSLRAAPITFRCGWAGVPLSADKIIARQLAKAAFGWMGTARHLVGPSLCRSNAFRTGGLRASTASLSPSSGDRQLMLIRCRIFCFLGTSGSYSCLSVSSFPAERIG